MWCYMLIVKLVQANFHSTDSQCWYSSHFKKFFCLIFPLIFFFFFYFLIFTAMFYEQALSNMLIVSRFSVSMGWPCIDLFIRSSLKRLKCYFWAKSYTVGILPADIYLVKVNSRNTRTRCEICSTLAIKIPEWYLVSLLLTLNIFHTLF